MTQKRTSGSEAVLTGAPPVKVAIITLDSHLLGAVDRVRAELVQTVPNLELSLHAAVDWAKAPETLAETKRAIAEADILVVTMLFIEDHIQAVMEDLKARRDNCDAIVCCMSAGEVIKLTRLGRFIMGGKESPAVKMLKRLKGSAKPGASSGAKQMSMLRRLPRILRFIPGSAQDMRAYFLTMQYWLACSDDNLTSMVRFLIDRYAAGEREIYRGRLPAAAPVDYHEVGLYHPTLKGRTTDDPADLPKVTKRTKGTVGLMLMRSYVLAGDTGHYDGVIAAFEAAGYRVVPVFANGLDSRPAAEAYFFDDDGRVTVDAVVSLSGFSLVGGPAYNDSDAAAEMMRRLDVPCIAAHALEFQTLADWRRSSGGLLPVESTIMVAIPELDGAIAPTVFGGRESLDGDAQTGARRMVVDTERAAALVARTARQITLKQAAKAERRIAVVLFNFPPNSGATGTAAYLGVFESLFNTLHALKADGYTVEVPESVDALRDALLIGNTAEFGADANVAHRIPVDDHVKREPHLKEIEAAWGSAPGRAQSDGRSIHVYGLHLGNVFVGVQPAFGYEGDPMRLLFEKGFAPTHAFSAFYRYLREDFAAHAVLHFGTHGALEFMPGKQTGLSGACWPERLIGDLPNFYFYAANNPSEGVIAKRRSAATLLSYMTPPLKQAGLYKGLIELKETIERWRKTEPEEADQRVRLADLIATQAQTLDLVAADARWTGEATDEIARLQDDVRELEETLIPFGLHVLGDGVAQAERADYLRVIAEANHALNLGDAALDALLAGKGGDAAIRAAGLKADKETRAAFAKLSEIAGHLGRDSELPAMLHALDGGYTPPAPGGDLLRTPEVLPTGRNLHGFDPFRMPSAFAVEDGARQAGRLLARHLDDGAGFPESIALVLWGTDNLKSEGGPIAQALSLMGARPRFDSFGRLAGAALIPLEELGRPRIDVVMTLSGIFRDLLPLQVKLLAEAAWLAASADESPEQNFVRKHTLAYQARRGCDFETAALRVFSNADGAYGANVNQMVDGGAWDDEEELGDVFAKRKCFAYGRGGQPAQQEDLLKDMLGGVDFAYQNLESVELGVTTIDHYFDSLGGITRAAASARGGEAIPVYVSDQTGADGKVRTLSEQVALETRTRMLNPTWYEGMLKHGYEGVRQIEAQVTNTLGWSATTGQVQPWVYQQLTETFVLDADMRKRLATLNPKASARVANRLLEAHERRYWEPDEETLAALKAAGEELENRLEGIHEEEAAA
ncbi:MAG: magnesium chelatase subunit H [Marivibrio sp.]|uniref:magnesium chelatase subunit H n=1 Tax=Marivibrio sp. TaxID=2039719 RepID=UPI0032ED6E00